MKEHVAVLWESTPVVWAIDATKDRAFDRGAVTPNVSQSEMGTVTVSPENDLRDVERLADVVDVVGVLIRVVRREIDCLARALLPRLLVSSRAWPASRRARLTRDPTARQSFDECRD
jgi:hypothetical protein